MPDDAPQLLTVPEVAKIIRCSPRTVRDRIEARVIPGFKLIGANGRPSEWRVSVSGLNDYLRKCGAVTVVVLPKKRRGPSADELEARHQAALAKLGWLPGRKRGRRGSLRTPEPCGANDGPTT